MDIIMVRHGESEDNINKIFSRDNTSLTHQGIEQILKTKELLKKFSYDKVYYSPFKRTVETLKVLGLTGIKEPSLREFNFGIFTGKTYEEITIKYPEETKQWVEDSKNYIIPKGESLLNVYDRVSEFLEEISTKDEDVLLIVHDCVIRLALCWVFENPDYFFRFKVDNGSINIISIDNGYKYIRKLNYY